MECSALSERFGIPLAGELSEFPFVKDKVQLIPYAFAKKRAILPLKEEEGTIVVALTDPLDL
jgi:hypothetical protein